MTIPLASGNDGRPAGGAGPSYVVVLHSGTPPVADDTADPIVVVPAVLAQVGRPVADYVLVYADGSERRQPVRWRYEITGAGAGAGVRRPAIRAAGASGLPRPGAAQRLGALPDRRRGGWRCAVPLRAA